MGGSTEVKSKRPREHNSTTEPGPFLPGTSTLESSTATAWQFYPLVASSSLLLVYLAFLVLRYTYSRSKLVQGWTRRLIGNPPMLLHTLPYYLAITRSSCEAHVLNLPIGHQASNNANDTVKI